MGVFNIKYAEPNSYKNRRKSAQIINILLSFAIFVIVAFNSDWKDGLFIALLILTVQYFKSIRWERYFIIQLNQKDDQIFILYKEQDQKKEISGHIKDFIFKKKIAFNRTKTPYLAVYYKNNLLIKQFEIGDWNEKEFDKVIDSM
jgi:hypothetical protein